MLQEFRFTSDKCYTSVLQPDDAMGLFAMYSDEEAMRFRGSAPMSSVQDAAAMIVEQYQDDSEMTSRRLGIRRGEGDHLIGTLLLKVHKAHPNRCEIGFSFGKDYWGQGYAQHVLGLLCAAPLMKGSFEELFAWVVMENEASVHVFRKEGFAIRPQVEYPQSYLFYKELER